MRREPAAERVGRLHLAYPGGVSGVPICGGTGRTAPLSAVDCPQCLALSRAERDRAARREAARRRRRDVR